MQDDVAMERAIAFCQQAGTPCYTLYPDGWMKDETGVFPDKWMGDGPEPTAYQRDLADARHDYEIATRNLEFAQKWLLHAKNKLIALETRS